MSGWNAIVEETDPELDGAVTCRRTRISVYADDGTGSIPM